MAKGTAAAGKTDLEMEIERRRFRHEALVYADAEGFLAGTVPFLLAALEASEPALVAVSRTRARELRGELGKDAAAVDFVEMEGLGRNPARIIPFWRDFVGGLGGRPARGISEPVWPGRRSAEIEECQRHESLLNIAFPPTSAWSLLCPYDGGALADDVLERVAGSHPTVRRDGRREVRDAQPADGDCFAGRLSAPPSGAESFGFDRSGLAEVRRRVEATAADAGLGAAAAADLVVAASELAANSIAHGGGAGTLRAWREADRLLVEFEDLGTIEEALVGRLRPTLTQEGGRGLWLANQLCDLVQIRSGSHGTTVRLQAALA